LGGPVSIDEIKRREAAEDEKLTGIGGFLWLPILGLCATIGYGLFGLYGLFVVGTSDGQEHAVPTAILVVSIDLVAPITLLVGLVQRRKWVRWSYATFIVAATANATYAIQQYGGAHSLDGHPVSILSNTTVVRLIWQNALNALVFLPYMLISRRARLTFTR
jgi:hypothetical protein